MEEFNFDKLVNVVIDYFMYYPQSWAMAAGILFGSIILNLILLLVTLQLNPVKKKIIFYYRLPFALVCSTLVSIVLLSGVALHGTLFNSWIIVGDLQSFFIVSLLIQLVVLVYSFLLYSRRLKRENLTPIITTTSERNLIFIRERMGKIFKQLRLFSISVLLPFVLIFSISNQKFVYSFIVDNSVSMELYGNQVSESIYNIADKTSGDFDLVFTYFDNIEAPVDPTSISELSKEKNPDLLSLCITNKYSKTEGLYEFLESIDENLFNYQVQHTPLLQAIKKCGLYCSDLFVENNYSRKVLFLLTDGYLTNNDFASKPSDPLEWRSPEVSTYDNFDEVVLIKVSTENQSASNINLFDHLETDEKTNVSIIDLDDEANLNSLLRDITYVDFIDVYLSYVMIGLSLITLICLFLFRV